MRTEISIRGRRGRVWKERFETPLRFLPGMVTTTPRGTALVLRVEIRTVGERTVQVVETVSRERLEARQRAALGR